MSTRSAILETRLDAARTRMAEYLELTKPRVTLMVLVTTLAGYYLGATGAFEIVVAVNLLIGTALASGGTLALNQYMERDTDAMMDRTRHRPIPDKRIEPVDALWFGVITTAAGLGYLLLTVNWLAALVTAAIALSYLLAYTPLKRVSWSCNIVGAIPGALPPVAGWAAARGTLSVEPWIMFAIMFLWQLPHSLSIAKLYRADYKRARLWLIPLDRENSYPGKSGHRRIEHRPADGRRAPDVPGIRRNHLPGHLAGTRMRDAGGRYCFGAWRRKRSRGASRHVRITLLSAGSVAGDGSG